MADSFTINALYSHEEIFRSLGVGNAGGVRFLVGNDGTTRRAVLFTSVPDGKLLSENPYQDRIEQDVLIYTAQGRKGDQGFGGQNQRLLQHGVEKYPIYCFQLICSRRNRSIGIKRWRFLGFLFGLRRYKERQIDISGVVRSACVFEFSIISDFGTVIISEDQLLAQGIYSAFEKTNSLSYSESETPIQTNAYSWNGESFNVDELERVRSQMLNLHPSRFEFLVKNALENSGFTNVSTTRYSKDGGIDVDAYAGEQHWVLNRLHLQVQAKRWIHTVGRKEVAELRGSLGRFARGALITTSQFSKSALDEAYDTEKLPIAMIDGYDFARIIKGLRIAI